MSDSTIGHSTSGKFRVALTADFYNADGSPKYRDMGLSIFQGHDEIECSPLSAHRPQLGADQIAGAQGVIVLTPAVTADSVSNADRLLAIGRFGVGYDAVDVDACTAADIVVFITAGAVDRSVAEATVGWMIALSHHLRVKDNLVRSGGWDQRSRYMGRELRDRTFGAVGFGGIARATVRLLESFGMRQPLAFDPYLQPEDAERLGLCLVTLDELMSRADFVSIHCPLTPETRNLIGAAQIGLMKRDAYLINTARGGIVDEAALHGALAGGRIAGAALDCFIGEPLAADNRWAQLDNVLLAPHSIAWTDELFRDIGRAVCQGMLDLANGERPHGVVNPQVFERATFREKWRRLTVA